jgi:hypothetical protein
MATWIVGAYTFGFESQKFETSVSNYITAIETLSMLFGEDYSLADDYDSLIDACQEEVEMILSGQKDPSNQEHDIGERRYYVTRVD